MDRGIPKTKLFISVSLDEGVENVVVDSDSAIGRQVGYNMAVALEPALTEINRIVSEIKDATNQ